jgi:two-component sensor histidine kinase
VSAGDRGKELYIDWREEGGPPVEQPETFGFGTTMLSKAAVYQHQGGAELIWQESGLVCRLKLPLSEAGAGTRPPSPDAGISPYTA